MDRVFGRHRLNRGSYRRGVVGVTIAFMLVASLQACSVPVFRYALDHWKPDRYRLVVFNKGTLSESEKKQLTTISQSGPSQLANMDVEIVDVSKELTPTNAALWKRYGSEQYPHCVLLQPTIQKGVYRSVFERPLDQLVVQSLSDSPARRTITDSILDGASVIWVYIDSTDGKDDDDRFAAVEAKVTQLESELELPEIEPEDLTELSTAPEELKIRFDCLRISRTSAEEAHLIDLLQTTESDLRDADLKDQAMLFPVFGRGRVLYALVGPGINDDTVTEAATFLVGACQCTVKAENPGVDLLMSVDWDQLVTPSGPVDVDVPLTGLAAFLEEPDEAAGSSDSARNASAPTTTPADATAEQSASADASIGNSGAFWRSPLMMVMLVLVIAVAGCATLTRR